MRLDRHAKSCYPQAYDKNLQFHKVKRGSSGRHDKAIMVILVLVPEGQAFAHRKGRHLAAAVRPGHWFNFQQSIGNTTTRWAYQDYV